MVHTALAMRTADAQAAVQCANMCYPGESAPFGDDRKWLSVGSNAHPHRTPACAQSRGGAGTGAEDAAAARKFAAACPPELEKELKAYHFDQHHLAATQSFRIAGNWKLGQEFDGEAYYGSQYQSHLRAIVSKSRAIVHEKQK